MKGGLKGEWGAAVQEGQGGVSGAQRPCIEDMLSWWTCVQDTQCWS